MDPIIYSLEGSNSSSKISDSKGSNSSSKTSHLDEDCPEGNISLLKKRKPDSCSTEEDEEEEEEEDEEEDGIYGDPNDPVDAEIARQLREYSKHCWQSEGFDIDINKVPECVLLGGLIPLDLKTENQRHIDRATEATRFAIAQHNDQKGENLEFLKILTINSGPCAGIRYYITFEARDFVSRDTGTYQTRVYCSWNGSFEVQVFRPKPSLIKE